MGKGGRRKAGGEAEGKGESEGGKGKEGKGKGKEGKVERERKALVFQAERRKETGTGYFLHFLFYTLASGLGSPFQAQKRLFQATCFFYTFSPQFSKNCIQFLQFFLQTSLCRVGMRPGDVSELKKMRNV